MNFITEYIPVKDLQCGDLILFDGARISEVVSFSGDVLILRAIIDDQIQNGTFYIYHLEGKLTKGIQIIKENATFKRYAKKGG